MTAPSTIEAIPLPENPEPHFSQRTVFGGSEFVLRFDWSERAQRWSLGIYDASEIPILTGSVLVQGLPITHRVRDSRFVNGDLFFLGRAESLEALGDGSCSLVYMEP